MAPPMYSQPSDQFSPATHSPIPVSDMQGPSPSPAETQQVMEVAQGIFEGDPQLGIDFVLR